MAKILSISPNSWSSYSWIPVKLIQLSHVVYFVGYHSFIMQLKHCCLCRYCYVLLPFLFHFELTSEYVNTCTPLRNIQSRDWICYYSSLYVVVNFRVKSLAGGWICCTYYLAKQNKVRYSPIEPSPYCQFLSELNMLKYGKLHVQQ